MKLLARLILACAILAPLPQNGANAQVAVQRPATQTETAEPALTADESGVYTAILAEVFQATVDTQIMLLDHTSIGVPPGMWAVTSVQGPETAKFITQFSTETRQDYNLKNKQSVRLAGECKFAPRCEFDNVVALTGIVGAEKDKMEKGWKEFNKRFPNAPGIFVVSRVGFNHDHTEALAYAGRSCGNLCGNGYYVRLVKRDGAWAVAGQTTIWIA
jgi:hypothetical protein